MQRLENDDLVERAHTHKSTCKGPRARHLMIDHQPGAIPLSELPGF